MQTKNGGYRYIFYFNEFQNTLIVLFDLRFIKHNPHPVLRYTLQFRRIICQFNYRVEYRFTVICHNQTVYFMGRTIHTEFSCSYWKLSSCITGIWICLFGLFFSSSCVQGHGLHEQHHPLASMRHRKLIHSAIITTNVSTYTGGNVFVKVICVSMKNWDTHGPCAGTRMHAMMIN